MAIPSHSSNIAYSLIYPSKDYPNLKQCLYLIANDTAGLEVLANKYTSATTLYDTHDFSLWAHLEDKHQLVSQITFDENGNPSRPPNPLLTLPNHSNEIWNAIYKEMIINETQISSLAVNAIFSLQDNFPNLINEQIIDNTIPNDRLALVTLDSAYDASIGNAIINALNSPLIHGIDEVSGNSKLTFDPLKLHSYKNPFSFVTNLSAIETLSTEERSQISIDILPYSLKEMFLKEISNKEDFGRKFLRIANAQTPNEDTL